MTFRCTHDPVFTARAHIGTASRACRRAETASGPLALAHSVLRPAVGAKELS